MTRASLLALTVGILFLYDLYRSGAEPRRLAWKHCLRLQARRWWPNTAEEVSDLADVKKLRKAANGDPGPVFTLFQDARPEVRMAAFLSLDQRTGWRTKEAAILLSATQATLEPSVRAAAVMTLGTVDEPAAIAGLTGFFRDPSIEVRRAAIRAVLREGGRKWAFVRDGVRLALSDTKVSSKEAEGLVGSAGYLPVVAICDLTTWAGEPEPLASRAVRTLVDHYTRKLQSTENNLDLITELTGQLTTPGTPAALRVELAGLLRTLGYLSPELLDRMTNADQPGPIRLLATEALLDTNPTHPDALDVLRGLARQPNREMSLAIARILQDRLGVDVGLPERGYLAPNSKQAGEVARRVLSWATGRMQPTSSPSTPILEEIEPLSMLSPAPQPRLPGSSADLNPKLPPPAPGKLKAGKNSWG